jgi:hypothetical protein
LRNYDTISETCGGGEGRKTEVFTGTTSAFGTGGELGSELVRTNGRGILEDTGRYEGKAYNGQYVQHYR